MLQSAILADVHFDAVSEGSVSSLSPRRPGVQVNSSAWLSSLGRLFTSRDKTFGLSSRLRRDIGLDTTARG